MKHLFLILIGMLFTITLSSQSIFDDFYNDFGSEEGVGKIDLSGSFLQFSKSEDGKTIELDRIKGLIFGKENRLKQDDLDDVVRKMDRKRFDYLLRVREGGNNIDIYGLDKGDYFSNVVLIVRSKEQDILLDISGKIYMESLDDLNLDLEGLQFLNGLNLNKT
jgi:hypothetical protein